MTDIYLNKADEFTELGYKVVQEILLKRLGSLPEHKPDTISQPFELGDGESVSLNEDDIQSEFRPEFYNPNNVIRLEKLLYAAGRTLLWVLTLSLFTTYPYYQNFIRTYFPGLMSNPFIIIFLTVIIMILNYVLSVVVMVLPLIGIAKLLRILMQMELDSRGITLTVVPSAAKPFVKGDTWLSKMLNWEQW